MKLNRTIHLALAVGALGILPAFASAQTGSSGQPQQGSQGGQQGSQGGQRSSQSGEPPHSRQHQAQKKGTQKIQEQVSLPIENGCTYTASVNGKIQRKGAGRTHGSESGAQGQSGSPSSGSQAQGGSPSGSQTPAASAQGQGAQERVSPDLIINASLTCPNAADVRISETLKTDTPVTRSELEEMIGRRTSISTARSGRLCMYVPQFELTEDKLTNRGVVQLCRVPAQNEKPQPEQPKQGMR